MMPNPHRELSDFDRSGRRQVLPADNISSARVSTYCRIIVGTTLVLHAALCCFAAASMVLTALFVGEPGWTFILIVLASAVVSFIMGAALIFDSKIAWWGSLAHLSVAGAAFFWIGLNINFLGGLVHSWPAFAISAAFLPGIIACLTQLVTPRYHRNH